MRLKDKVAIVTGGSHGLGKAYVISYAREGAKVVIVANKDIEGAKAVKETVEKEGGEALVVIADVSSEADTLDMVKKTVECFGKIDILVNNAGPVNKPATLSRSVPFYELSLDEWNRLLAVHVTGPFLCARAVFPYMKAQGKGKIINVSSGQFFYIRGKVKYAHYITCKGAIIGLTRALAFELGEYNINVNCIAPGSVLTEDPNDTQAVELRSRGIDDRLIKRIQYPEDVVGTAIFLASSDSDFLTGQTIVVDGGTTFW